MFILPGRNFARFNLMVFILFSLVVRTAYQGVQFDMMLKEMRPKDVKTIDELLEKNFTIYGLVDLLGFGHLEYRDRFCF